MGFVVVSEYIVVLGDGVTGNAVEPCFNSGVDTANDGGFVGLLGLGKSARWKPEKEEENRQRQAAAAAANDPHDLH
jgi:hypothetical protein